MIRQGGFREDLFYRLNVIRSRCLRSGSGARTFPCWPSTSSRASRERQGRTLRLGAGAMDRLLRYAWPGNVRELENAMERTAILARDDTIEPGDLATARGRGPLPRAGAGAPAPEQTLAEAERAHIIQILERYGWNHSRAAEALGIGRTTLWRKLKEYGIEK